MSSSEASSSDAEEQPGENVEYSEAKGDGTMYVIFGVLAVVVIVVIVLLVIFFTRGEHEGPAMMNGTVTAGEPTTGTTMSGMMTGTDIPGTNISRMTHSGMSNMTRHRGPATGHMPTSGVETTLVSKATTKMMTTTHSVMTIPSTKATSVASAPTTVTTLAPPVTPPSTNVSLQPHGGRAGAEESGDAPSIEVKTTAPPTDSTHRRHKVFVLTDTTGPELVTLDPNYIPNREKPGSHDGGGPPGSVLKRSPTNGSDIVQPPDGNSTRGLISANDTAGVKLAEQDAVPFSSSNASDTGVKEQPEDSSASVADDDEDGTEREEKATLRSNRTTAPSPVAAEQAATADPHTEAPTNNTPRFVAPVDYQHGPYPSQLVPVPLEDIAR